MLTSSMFAVLTAIGLAAATPVDLSVQGRGITPSKPENIHCTGEIIGYRTVSTLPLANKVNLAHKFPKDTPHGDDIGGNSVYFSDTFGAFGGDGGGMHWCVAYADISKLKAADKVWFPENETLKKCTRFDDNKIDAWILTVSKDKFTPAETLRLSKFEDYQQLAIPYAMLDDMKVCGKCYPIAEGKRIKSQYPIIDWKSGPWVGSNTIKKRDALDPRAPAVCPLNSKPAPTPTPKGKATPKPKGKATPKPKAARPKAARPKTSRPEASKPKAKEPAKKDQGRA